MVSGYNKIYIDQSAKIKLGLIQNRYKYYKTHRTFAIKYKQG